MRCAYRKSHESHRTFRETLRCARCNNLGLMPPSGDANRLHTECTGWPLWFEFGYWTELLLSAFYLTPRSRWALWQYWGVRCKSCDKRESALNRLGRWLYRVMLRNHSSTGVSTSTPK